MPLAAADEERIEPEVVAAVYADHAEQLQRFLVGMLRDKQLAQDVLQATFARFVERGHETQRESRKAWLFRVAYNEAMAIRRRQAVGEKVVRKAAWTVETAGRAADEPLIRGETVDRVRAALEQLPEPQRRVVEKRIYEDKTFAVIAEELDIPLGTALGRMRAALMKLKSTLDEIES